MLYQLCDAIYKQAGREGIMKTLAEVREKGIILSLENLYADGKGYDIAKKLSDALDKLPYDTIYGYRGSLISRLEVIKEERRTPVMPYPYPVKEKLTPAQQGLLDASDALFNAELLAFKEHNIRGLMHLGRPLALLRTIGVNAEEITLSPKILNRHLNTHGLSVDDLQGLARAIQTPILAYNHGLESMNKVLVSDIFVKGGKLSVSLQLDDNGKVVELNNVKSIHQKDAIEEIERLSYVGEDLKKLLLWVEKEKVMDWFSPVDLYSPIQASNPKLISVAKILKDFENPKIIEEKNDILEENSTKESFSSEMEGEIAADDMEKVQQSKDNLRGLLNEVRSDIGEDFDFIPTKLETVFDNGQPVTLVAFKNGEFIDSNGNSKEVRDLFNEIKAGGDVKAMSSALHGAHMIGLEYAGVMAIHDRIVTSSARSFTDEQVAALNKYHQKVCYDMPAKESFDILFKQASEMPDVKDCPKQWSADALDELNDLVKGIMRNDAEVIRLK